MDLSIEIDCDKIKPSLPLRLLSIGSMNTGKTYFVLQFIENIHRIAQNINNNSQIEILLLSENNETAMKLQNICSTKSFQFYHYRQLPYMMKGNKQVTDSKHRILIIEAWLILFYLNLHQEYIF